jgi:hypothetical protein
MMDVDRIMDALWVLGPHSDVAKHVAGKIELKLRISGLNALMGNNWEGLIESIPGILSSRLQLLSRKIVIEYDPRVLPEDLWEDIARLKDEPDLEHHVRRRLKTLSSSGT